jgi:hypothetical protein
MSNMAAAATIGSNHNSRANDGEIQAKRGFWPGLAVSLKHSSVFASFVIIAKGEYPSELNIPLPFSLVNNNVYKNRLEVMPAYYWMYNLYALERNSWKVKNRDKRKIKIQHIEFDYLAPDTAEEIIASLLLLDNLLGEAGLNPLDVDNEDGVLVRHIHSHEFEYGKRNQVIIKPLEAITAYRQMLHYYAVKTIAEFFDTQQKLDYNGLHNLLGANNHERVKEWVNAGGQIVPAFRVDKLRKEIGEGKYKNWDEIHGIYDLWHEEYQLDKAKHAWAALTLLQDNAEKVPDIAKFKKELADVLNTRDWIDTHIYESREKDYLNPFKKATFRNDAEMELILGNPDNSPFFNVVKKESADFKEMIKRVSTRLG